jgi:hypothetical protein
MLLEIGDFVGNYTCSVLMLVNPKKLNEGDNERSCTAFVDAVRSAFHGTLKANRQKDYENQIRLNPHFPSDCSFW